MSMGYDSYFLNIPMIFACIKKGMHACVKKLTVASSMLNPFEWRSVSLYYIKMSL
jgi:hypothetical protein